MTQNDSAEPAGGIQERRSQLLEELRELEATIHGPVRRDLHSNADELRSLEKRVRALVLRLSDLEREEIESRALGSG